MSQLLNSNHSYFLYTARNLVYVDFNTPTFFPLNFSDLSIENLHYLSSEQALADLATFIQSMNEKHSFGSDVKWIAFGGSYPGSLAAWLREKYSNLVHGSISTSGPLLALADFYR